MSTITWHRPTYADNIFFAEFFKECRSGSGDGGSVWIARRDGQPVGAVGRNGHRERYGYDWWCSDDDLCGPHTAMFYARRCFEVRHTT